MVLRSDGSQVVLPARPKGKRTIGPSGREADETEKLLPSDNPHLLLVTIENSICFLAFLKG